MIVKQIEYSTNFVKQFKKLTPQVKKQAIKAELLFRKDPFSPRIKTHKLTGKLSNLWAFSIDYRNRIIFEFIDEGKVVFYRIGSHEIYR